MTMPDIAARDEARARTRWMMALRRDGGAALVVAAAIPLLSGGALVAQAALLAVLLDRAIADGAALPELWPLLAGIAGLIVLRAALGYAAERAGIAAAERIKRTLRERLFARMLAQRPDWTAERASGALTSAVVDQVESLDGFFSKFFPAMVQAAVLPVAFAVVIMPVDWIVGLLFLFTAPMIPLFMTLVGWGAQAAGERHAHALARLSGYFADRLRGLVTLKLFGRAEAEAASMRAASEALRTRTLAVLRIAFLSSAVLEFFAALGVAGVALYVGLSYLDMIDMRATPLTLQAGLFCLLMAPEVYQPLRLLAAHYHDRAGAVAAVAEIARLFGELPPRPVSESAETPLPHISRAVRVEASALRLATPDGGRIVLANADLSINAGSSVALLGPSGIGKSTLLEALAGLRQTQGQIRLGGRFLAAMDETELHATVVLVGQRPRIFHGTIGENIALGCRHADDAAIRRAAERALVTRFTDRLPAGLDTLVGEGGFGLSGGEAHRVALARVYLRPRPLILLDEPTAHLDAATESAVLDELLAFAEGRTLIVATHSAAVARRMDRTLRFAGDRLLPTARTCSGTPSVIEENAA